LGATDRGINKMGRFAACFHDERRPDLIEHEVVTPVGQRVFGIALGYADLNDHDELRHGHQAVAAAASGNRPMSSATTACPLRRPATHSLTTAGAIWSPSQPGAP
jgi:hypothetical protein